MDEDAETGGRRSGQPRAAARSGTPESRPQLEELRSGKWVTEPVLPEAAPPTDTMQGARFKVSRVVPPTTHRRER
jgi:hypothetical protein